MAATCPASDDLPAVAVGEIPFHLDGAVLLEPDGRPLAHFHLGLPQEDLRCTEGEAEGTRARLEARLSFLDREGTPLTSLTTELDVPCTEADPEAAFSRQTVTLIAPPAEGATRFELRLADRQALRQGLLNELRDIPRAGTVVASFRLPVRSGPLGLGGPLFAWNVQEGPGIARDQGYLIADASELRAALEANPARDYGLFQPMLLLYAELYGFAGRGAEVALRVLGGGPEEIELYSETRVLSIPHACCGVARRLDVTQLAAGSYEVDLSVRTPPDSAGRSAPELRTRAPFQIHWDPESWVRPWHARMQEASLLMDPERWGRFLQLGFGEQEVLLDSLWHSLGGHDDPAQLKSQFRQRIAEADLRFIGLQRGSLTDRGRVFVSFGDPDEIHKELAPQDEDLIYYFLQREIDKTEAEEAGGRPRRHPMDTSPYQVWYYINWGQPLFEQLYARSRGGSGGLRFIFVDEMGTGEYRLIYTNLFGGFD